MYVLDSICKNIRSYDDVYRKLFARNIVKLVVHVFEKVNAHRGPASPDPLSPPFLYGFLHEARLREYISGSEEKRIRAMPQQLPSTLGVCLVSTVNACMATN